MGPQGTATPITWVLTIDPLLLGSNLAAQTIDRAGCLGDHFKPCPWAEGVVHFGWFPCKQTIISSLIKSWESGVQRQKKGLEPRVQSHHELHSPR